MFLPADSRSVLVSEKVSSLSVFSAAEGRGDVIEVVGMLGRRSIEVGLTKLEAGYDEGRCEGVMVEN